MSGHIRAKKLKGKKVKKKKKDACTTESLHSINQTYQLTTRMSEKLLTPNENALADFIPGLSGYSKYS